MIQHRSISEDFSLTGIWASATTRIPFAFDMVAVVVPPAADLPVHIINFPIMRFDQLMLIGSNLFIYFLGEESHLLHLMLMIARFTPS